MLVKMNFFLFPKNRKDNKQDLLSCTITRTLGHTMGNLILNLKKTYRPLQKTFLQFTIKNNYNAEQAKVIFMPLKASFTPARMRSNTLQ